MEEEGVEMDEFSYGSALQALSLSEDSTELLRLYRVMKRNKNLQAPNKIVKQTLIIGLGRDTSKPSGGLEALRIFDTIKNKDVTLFNACMKANYRDYGVVMRLFNRVMKLYLTGNKGKGTKYVENGYNRKFKPDDVTIMTVLGSLEDSGRLDISDKVFTTALSYGLFSKFDRPLDTTCERDVSGWPIAIVKPGLRYYLRVWREEGEEEDFVCITGVGKERKDDKSTLNEFVKENVGGVSVGGTVIVRRGEGKMF
ncbi:hypothetical protein TrST_g11693 [Triparma strigata]|uniref:Uncharacterized protein n=1 Tax=Triparma strigata TaxID=1606541 RepID=A0A9W7APF7_9STRA|nr:hypothetical protein TrST_g11693 [Triparma strigata]